MKALEGVGAAKPLPGKGGAQSHSITARLTAGMEAGETESSSMPTLI